ncbi:MAG: hypothetical protein K6E69_03040 [Treponema sp.]|uniref:hypothetical protein n=1 Tax=Treponema sp. TaxID=166 RepID=UPI00298DCAC4|nr:hypothetical protein [Treponema sp.]MCR5386074.1 hypothetical protein [Treponema sp.]
MYHYAGNNPVCYTDPNGEVAFCVVTAAIGAVVGAGVAAYSSYKKTGKVDALSVVQGALIGGVTGLVFGALGAQAATSTAVQAGNCLASFAEVTGFGAASATATAATATAAGAGSAATTAGNTFGNLSKAAEYGINTYSQLRNAVVGKGLQVHHIIEQRFLNCPALQKLGLTANKMLSVVLTPEEHQQFTNKWRAAFAYGIDYATITVEQIWEKAQEIYANYPELLQAAKETLFGK